VFIQYHETLTSQPKSSRTYALLHKNIVEGIIANEEQPDHYGDRHEEWMPVQNVLEIHRATG
jgi:hypothetical protein